VNQVSTFYASVGDQTVMLTADGYDLRRPQAFYRPYYELTIEKPAGTPLVHVHVRCTGRSADAPPVTAMGKYLEPSDPQHITSSPDGLVFPRPVPDVTVRVSRKDKRIDIVGDHPTHVELQTRTLVRDQLLGQLEKLAGWVVFHAAAVQRAGAGVAFLGHRNAGKTSSLIALMSTGKYDFLSGDRVKLRLAASGPEMRGMPARCNLHRIALETDPFLRPLAAGRRYDAEDKCLVEVGDLTRLAGVDHVAGADLRALVLPNLSAGHRGVRAEVLTDADAIRRHLLEQVMEGTPADKHVHWLHYMPDTAVSLDARLRCVADQIVDKVPVIAVRSNYHEYVEAIRAGSFDPLDLAAGG
jgi:hypothetical protein